MVQATEATTSQNKTLLATSSLSNLCFLPAYPQYRHLTVGCGWSWATGYYSHQICNGNLLLSSPPLYRAPLYTPLWVIPSLTQGQGSPTVNSQLLPVYPYPKTMVGNQAMNWVTHTTRKASRANSTIIAQRDPIQPHELWRPLVLVLANLLTSECTPIFILNPVPCTNFATLGS